MRNSLLIILFFSVFVFSCSKEKETTTDLGYSYAGLELGKYVVYDVDSIFYDDFTSSSDTTIFKLKEIVAESYIDLEGEEAFVIHRYKKYHDTLSWVLTDVWNAKRTNTNYQKVEENIRFVKLVFPVRQNSQWNGNSMNNNISQTYQYTVVDNSETVGITALNDVLTVTQDDDQTNLIHPVLYEEKFAKGIGMVYKRSMDLERNNLSSPWRGLDVTYTLSSYGN